MTSPGAATPRDTGDATTVPASPGHTSREVAPTPDPVPQASHSTLTAQGSPPPLAFGILVNPVGAILSSLVNHVTVVSPMLLLGDGRVACLLVPQAYASLRERVGGAGAQVGFRIFSKRRYDGLYFGVRFGGGVGNRAFKAFMGEIDAGWMWALGVFRLGLGVSAGGGYYAHDTTQGSLYLFSLDLSLGLAFGRFESQSR